MISDDCIVAHVSQQNELNQSANSLSDDDEELATLNLRKAAGPGKAIVRLDSCS